MKVIKLELDDQQARRFEGYRRRVIGHRRSDPTYLEKDYTEAEAASVLLGYGLDFVENLAPSDEEKIGIPAGFDIVAVGPRARK